MRVVAPSVTLVSATDAPEALIERMGRICYQSFKNTRAGLSVSDKAAEFIAMLIGRGHESVLEHASAGFSIVTDRGITHELVRHRLASYSQESTRYCNYSKDSFGRELTFVRPPFNSAEHESVWEAAMREAERSYLGMTNSGCAPELARSVLPNSLKSEIGMTANFREWRHFLRLRCSSKAHPQMREVAEMIREKLTIIAPSCFEDVP